MLRINKQGFTLIELMVVIVIIGVLASLAIPRFTEASVKAKVAEAPRVIASFESAYLAATAEGVTIGSEADLIFKSPESKWFTYSMSGTTAYTATKQTGLKGLPTNATQLITTYAVDATGNETFTHSATGFDKFVPNFLPNK
jgi:prepilin-type N-terminal cleavage/methylation domain-containing protein